MIIVSGAIRVLDGKREEMIAASNAMIAASRAEEGCVEYRYAFDMEDENVVAFTEVWQDMGALQQHLGSPHMAAFRQATMSLVAGRPEMSVFQGEAVQFG